jgi:hypothetical protein
MLISVNFFVVDRLAGGYWGGLRTILEAVEARAKTTCKRFAHPAP